MSPPKSKKEKEEEAELLKDSYDQSQDLDGGMGSWTYNMGELNTGTTVTTAGTGTLDDSLDIKFDVSDGLYQPSFDFDDDFCSLGLGSGRADRCFNDKRTVLAGIKKYCYGLVLYSSNSHRWPSIFHALGFAGCICIFYRKLNRRLFLYGWPGGHNPTC